MKSEAKVEEITSSWSTLWWILGTICLPISIPYLAMNLWAHVKEKKFRHQLPGKVVVITGASSGIGESLAHSFYRAGCKVVLTARRKEELERVRKDLLELHATIPTHPPVVMPLDLADLNSLPGHVDKILEIFGCIDILVNNGGISVRADAASTAVDVDIKIMLVNYFGSVAMTKAVIPSMIKRSEGRIVFISSIQGKIALPARSAYSASKHAIQAFSDSLRAEVARNNIKVTCVSPGYVKTSLSTNALTGTGETYNKMDDSTAFGTSPDKIADDILKAILRDSKEVILAQFSARVALWLRFIFPSAYFWIMEHRASKILSSKNK